MDKFIGVLGGMGTEATQFFYNTLISFSNAEVDQKHLKVLLFNNSKIPDRTNYILNNTDNPVFELVKTAKILENAEVDFIVMPCNTAHFFYEQIQNEVQIPIINVVLETVIELKRNYSKSVNVGLLATNGTIHADIYRKTFDKFNINLIYPDKDEQQIVNNMIYKIKSKQLNVTECLNNLINDFKKRENLGVIILGCTELSLIKNGITSGEIIDTNHLLALRSYVYAKNIEEISDCYNQKFNF